MYQIGSETFISLNELVDHYTKTPVFKHTKLTKSAPDVRRTKAVYMRKRNIMSMLVKEDYRSLEDDGLLLLKGFRLHNASWQEGVLSADLGMNRVQLVDMDKFIEPLKEVIF